ncbi:hypothetical protein EA797_02235 [Stutzerimonas zhaodongensis]|uniref:Uncharacterized protein n=1 Tax=Stutzerimonas zhaodongensis TaxID=1176257 RepID=A0A3M2HRB2_9GAMM|nr:hypothetical protein [Stutzerimonas zhaodongensis]MCQ4315540.1 hypothetical protein [Stutzerimonas zhaodongensis]RMH91588.1 hypothetical protein EA797_02235 [Stutzerimonas zhaodongensis]
MTAHYSPSAYQPARIPDQPAATKRSWLFRFGSSRLPWGHTEDIVPHSMLSHTSPAGLRDVERYEHALETGEEQREAYELLDYHQVIDHERYRHASLSKRSLFWFYLWVGGRFVFWVMAIFLPLTWLVGAAALDDEYLSNLLAIIKETAWTFLVPLACWAIGSLVVHKLTNCVVRPSKGPLWEFNRRTGMVTIFDYDNMGEHKRSGTIGEFSYPFHEFDAYISSGPDRQGLIWHQLHLVHRYHDLAIDLSPIVSKDSSMAPHFAAWDFLQNYMDTSRPLPDIPLFEQHRAQDPVTAEHDRRTARPERYWRDMDDETWDARLTQNLARVNAYDITGRLNLMARHVQYAD